MELTERETERLYAYIRKIRALPYAKAPRKNAIFNLCDQCTVILNRAGRRDKRQKSKEQ